MLFEYPSLSSTSLLSKRALYVGLSSLLLSISAAAFSAPAAKSRDISAAGSTPNPEVLLIEVYKALGANQLRSAQMKADALVAAYPNFQLGHLIRGDLLLMHTRPVTNLGAVSNAPEDKLKNLREEAMVRLRSLRERPAPNLIPRPVLQLRQDQKHVLIVDASRSRLYVYKNQGGQPTYVTDYYISQGKYGINKVKEGDQRTPVGVYYITGRLSAQRLPDFYGSGALPINYPNEWDKLHGRSGSGIWLHGTPSDTFSRPPLSSDGCVVLTNPDLHKLAESVDVGKTPVVIAEQVEFVDRSTWANERRLAANLVDRWRKDVEGADVSRLMLNYSKHFKSERGEDLATWFAKHQQFAHGIKNVSLTLRDVSYFLYPERTDLIVSTFTQDTVIGKKRTSVRKRQYWAKEGEQWRIVYEAIFSGNIL